MSTPFTIGKGEMTMIPNQMLQMLQQLKQNPLSFLSKKFNIPQNLNDPNQIIQHLIDTNQVSKEQVDQIMQMKNMFMG